MSKYDLIVVGGGFAGVGAALSAAKLGVNVMLIDKAGYLGGAATNCLVNPFMPHWTNTIKTNKKQYLSKGMFREICDELRSYDAIDSNDMVFNEEFLKLILNRMCLKYGVTLLFHSFLTGVNVENGIIKSVVVANKSGSETYEADYFIDATGDADLSVLAGCQTILGRPKDSLCQPMTLCFRLANVDVDTYKKVKPTINPLYKQFKKEGKIKNIREDVLIFHNMIEGVLHFNSTRIVKHNPVNAADVTLAEIKAREQVFELINFLKENIDGFQNCQLVMTAAEIGVRESRMIVGKHVLTEEELVACTKFEDSIAVGNYDIDIHNPEGSGTSHYYFKPETYYTIPYRSLQPNGFDNLLVAGRCISSTHEAQASYRIMPICCCLGQAAGTAVSIALESSSKVSDIDIEKLQKTLVDNGAVIY